jgi:hypothetical protein
MKKVVTGGLAALAARTTSTKERKPSLNNLVLRLPTFS